MERAADKPDRASSARGRGSGSGCVITSSEPLLYSASSVAQAQACAIDDADASHNLTSNINTSTALRIRFYDILRGTGVRLRPVHPGDVHGCAQGRVQGRVRAVWGVCAKCGAYLLAFGW